MKRLYAELAYMIGAVWLLARSVRLSVAEVDEEVEALEARRAARLEGRWRRVHIQR